MSRKILCCLALLAAACATEALSAAPGWTVSHVTGSVYVRTGTAEAKAWVGEPLGAGAVIRTSPGARAVLVRGNDFVVVSPNSQVRLPQPRQRPGIIQMIEDYGGALFKVEHRPNPHFGVQTPFLAAVVKGTTFRVTTARWGADVKVIQGAVGVGTADGRNEKLVVQGIRGQVTAAAPREVVLARASAEGGEEAADSALLKDSQLDTSADAGPDAASGGGSGWAAAGGSFPFLKIMLGAVAILVGFAISGLLLLKAWRLNGSDAGLGGAGLGDSGSRLSLRGFWLRRSRGDGEDDVSPAGERIGKIKDRKPRPVESADPIPNPARPAAAAEAAKPVEEPAPAEAAKEDERRQSKRSRVLLSGTVRTNEGEIAVRLHDISKTGAVAEASVVPASGSIVTFESGSVSSEAEVVWVRGNRFGLNFSSPIDDSSLLIDIQRSSRPRR